ncbi:VanZ family protein [Neobacillus cucumis]|uniref:VanZ family protein n=2 Tax=Neobacillus cucumis TaxID=1740721 RepID=A0A2N5HE53_9BACI|nr:VanZ family protein [Neobacillus cucumis]
MNKKLLWISLGISQVLYVCLLPVWFRLLSYLHPAVLGVIWMCLTIFVLFVVYYAGKGIIQISKILLKITITVYTVGLLILLFFRPASQDYSQINYIPFKTIGGFLLDEGNFLVAFYNLTANILLFVPFGVVALMFFRGLSRWNLILISAACITLIEILQHFTKRGSMDIDDLILNVLGVWIGYLISPVIQNVVKLRVR